MSEHPGVLTLPDIAYERAPIEVTINGRALRVEGWVRGPGCPARVVTEYARKNFLMVRSEDAPNAAYVEFLADTLKVVMPDLSHEDADLLAGDPDRAAMILRHLKWFADPNSEDEDAEDPEVQSEDGPTTPRSSLISLPTSAASDRTAAAG